MLLALNARSQESLVVDEPAATNAAPAVTAEISSQAPAGGDETNRRAREALEALLRQQLFSAFKFTFEVVDPDYEGSIHAHVEPLQQSAYNKLLSANLLHFESLEGNVPVVFDDKNIVLIDDNDKPLTPLPDLPGKSGRRFLVTMPLRIMRPCKWMKVVRGSQEILYKLCGHASDSGKFLVGGSLGPFSYRRPSTFWVQTGVSSVTQAIDNPKQKNSPFDTNQIGSRTSVGAIYHKMQGEIFARPTLASWGSQKFRPFWMQINFGYGWELPNFWWGIFPHVVLFGGAEMYRNRFTTKTSDTRYIKSYYAPLIGARTRFILTNRLDVGGDIQFTYGGESHKTFIQGDARYWLTRALSVGAGYWIDWANVASKYGQYQEVSLALESYVRYVF